MDGAPTDLQLQDSAAQFSRTWGTVLEDMGPLRPEKVAPGKVALSA